MRITFPGAAETVTGPRFLLEAEGIKLLIVCGLFPEIKKIHQRNEEPIHSILRIDMPDGMQIASHGDTGMLD